MPDKAAQMYPDESLDKGIRTCKEVFSQNHFVHEWFMESKGNYSWLIIHAKELIDEYRFRFWNDHPLKDDIETQYHSRMPDNIPDGAPNYFPMDLPEEYVTVEFENPGDEQVPPCVEVHYQRYMEANDAKDVYRKYVGDNDGQWNRSRTMPGWAMFRFMSNIIDAHNMALMGGMMR
tara:strand:- start:374 stop:901 length:528 start_codon:yes stop_codon:yes gene_type:complete